MNIDDYLLTIQWAYDDYPMTIRMTIRWLSDDYPMSIQWLSDEYPMTIQLLSHDYPMIMQWLSNNYPITIQWLSWTFNLFFLMIIDLNIARIANAVHYLIVNHWPPIHYRLSNEN